MVHVSTIKEVCARKARKSSVVSCGHYVLRGQLIVRKDGRWICGDCAWPADKDDVCGWAGSALTHLPCQSRG